MLDIYAVKLDKDIEHSMYMKVLSTISTEKRRKIDRYKKKEDAQRSLIGELLVRYILCNKFNLLNEDIVFFEDNYGKPYIHPKFNLNFNISHSAEWIVCAISEYPVGIDIEKILPIEFSIANHFFSMEEYNALISQDEGKKLTYFYQLWCAKESYIKAVGKGLSISLDSFTINIYNNLYSIKHNSENSKLYIKECEIDSNYVLVVCSQIEKEINHVQNVHLQSLLNYFARL